jgi:hypothetical protein
VCQVDALNIIIIQFESICIQPVIETPVVYAHQSILHLKTSGVQAVVISISKVCACQSILVADGRTVRSFNQDPVNATLDVDCVTGYNVVQS